jgi:hypothetical protein
VNEEDLERGGGRRLIQSWRRRRRKVYSKLTQRAERWTRRR